MPTDYAGEGYRLRTGDEKDFDGSALTPDKVLSVDVEVFSVNAEGAMQYPPVLDEIMEWDDVGKHWGYNWDTPGPAGATYKAFIIISNLDSSISLEGPKRIRFKTDPRPVA